MSTQERSPGNHCSSEFCCAASFLLMNLLFSCRAEKLKRYITQLEKDGFGQNGIRTKITCQNYTWQEKLMKNEKVNKILERTNAWKRKLPSKCFPLESRKPLQTSWIRTQLGNRLWRFFFVWAPQELRCRLGEKNAPARCRGGHICSHVFVLLPSLLQLTAVRPGCFTHCCRGNQRLHGALG